MKNSDLRIKNKLQKDNGEIFTVLRIDGTNDVLVEEQRGLLTLDYNLFGIPLTEEWLLKLGFTKGTDMWDDRAEYEYLFSEGKGVTVSDTNEIYMGCFSQTIKYVHQLQNLIFAMSGVELQLSST